MTAAASDPAPRFTPGEMLPEPLPADPFPLLVQWFNDAAARRLQPNPNSMAVATRDAAGAPSVRIVLCKAIDAAAGYLVFFTNYTSRKGDELLSDPRAAAVFHWDHQERQVRVEGIITRSPAAESDAYFASRSWESRIGAWASEQSRPLASRGQLLERVDATMARFGIDPAHPPAPDATIAIPRPPHWGGYRLHAARVELWCSCPGRVHDRAVWSRTLRPQGEGFSSGPWQATRLQP